MFADAHDLATARPALPVIHAEPAVPAAFGTAGLRLALSTRAMTRMLDVVDYGLILLADDGQVGYANERARSELAGTHPLVLNGNLLSARCIADAATLQQALHAATRRSAQSLLTLGDKLRGRVGVSVVPLVEPGELPMTLLVLGRRRACEELSREAFARHHALTPAEARVLKCLAQGDKPTDIARSQGVQLSTVRTQIGNIRLKTGARDIGQLVQLLARLPPLPCLLSGTG